MDVVKEEIAKGNFIIETKDHQHKELKIDDVEEAGYGRRANCRCCEIKVPRMMDLACGNRGVIWDAAGKATFVEVCSDVGAKLFDGAVKANTVVATEPIPKGVELRKNIEAAI
jgi:formate dehydrogenase subunit beta